MNTDFFFFVAHSWHTNIKHIWTDHPTYAIDLRANTLSIWWRTFRNLMKAHDSLSRWLNNAANVENVFPQILLAFGHRYALSWCTGELRCWSSPFFILNPLWHK